MLAGLLLVLPGFLTDLIGVVLLIGPVRRWFGATFRALGRPQPRAGARAVIDLAPGEWQQVPDREIANRSSKPRRN